MKRMLSALLLGAVATLVLGMGVAAAKFSYFSVELDPVSPQPGQPVTVIVRLWDDEAHTQPATWWPPAEALEDLLEFRGDGGRVPVTLTPAGVAEYRAEVTLTEGEWRLIPFPGAGGAVPGSLPAGYPSPLTITVVSPAEALAPVGIAAALLALAVMASLAARRPIRWPATARRGRSPSEPSHGTLTIPPDGHKRIGESG